MKIVQSWVYKLKDTGECYSSICRDLQSIKSTVDGDAKAFIHLGFEGLDRSLVAEVMNNFEGTIYASAAAYFSLKNYFRFENAVLTTINEEPIFCDVKQNQNPDLENVVLLQKDGVTRLSPTISQGIDRVDLSYFIQNNNEWVKAFNKSYPEKKAKLEEWSIDDDESYFSLEKKLEYDDRIQIGIFRQEYLHSVDCEDSPQNLLKTCPPWVLRRNISTVDFSVRVENVLREKQLEILKDLAALSDTNLLGLPNFGRKSLKDICDVIKTVLNEGPFGGEGHSQRILKKTLKSHVSDTIKGLSTREADILEKRMGLDCEPHTLEEIGSGYNITRERIRQIESKLIKKIVTAEFWDNVLYEKIEEFHKNQKNLLFLHHIVEIEPWLSGYSNRQHELKYLIENFCKNKFTILKYEGLEIISSLSRKQFEECLNLESDLVSNAIENRWSLSKFTHEVKAIFPINEGLLAHWIATQWGNSFHTIKNEQGSLEIISSNRGTNGAVLKVLEEANNPLHYSEVHKVLSNAGFEKEVRRVHQALGDVGYVFGRGKYGLEKHIPLSHEQTNIVINSVVELIYASEDKQWHTNELLDLLIDDIPFGNELSSDMINVILQTNKVELNYLGRNVWTRDDSEHINTSDRVDVRQAIIIIIEAHGTPMSGAAILDALKKERGLPRTVQIHPGAPLLRVGRGLWGLLDRDIKLSPKQRNTLLDFFYKYLDHSQKGISLTQVSTVRQIVQQLEHNDITPEALYGLCQLDSRFMLANGELIGLAMWGDLRCLTLRQACRTVLGGSSAGLTLSEVETEVNKLLLYEVNKINLSQQLGKIGEYDDGARKWRVIEDTTSLGCE